MRRLIIDRVEGNIAICETEEKEMIEICIERLPANSKEGDSINLLEDGSILQDEKRTKERKQILQGLMESLWEKF